VENQVSYSFGQVVGYCVAGERDGALIGLREARLIDDIVLRQVQARLNAEEHRSHRRGRTR
jgi:hypothetical protein